MAEIDGLTELARMLKDREPKTPPSISTGVVVAPPPDPQIRLNDTVILYKEHLIFAAHMLADYERAIKFDDTNCGTTTSVNDGGDNASSHTHEIAELHVDTIMKWKDTIVEGDEVILIPVVDSQLYYVIDKAVRFE